MLDFEARRTALEGLDPETPDSHESRCEGEYGVGVHGLRLFATRMREDRAHGNHEEPGGGQRGEDHRYVDYGGTTRPTAAKTPIKPMNLTVPAE